MANQTEQGYAVALGVFDGVHIGHSVVVGMMLLKKDLKKGIFTFKTESMQSKHGEALEYIYTTKQKEHRFDLIGIDKIYSADYNELKDLDGEEFCKLILKDKFNAKEVFCGYDFKFGKNAAWDVNSLKIFGEKYGFNVNPIDAVEVSGIPGEENAEPGKKISSKDIRIFLKSGQIERANRYLGVEYTINSEVIHGKELGRTLDFPTINQAFADGQLVPKFGVYASRTRINGKLYKSITNIGIKPTVSDEKVPLAETYIIDFSGDLYGTEPDVLLVDFMREEKKFSDLDQLKKAIQDDIKNRKDY